MTQYGTKRIKKKLSFILLNISFACYGATSQSANTSSLGLFPLIPRADIQGTTGDNSFGAGDAMMPLWGAADRFIYGDVTAKYGQSNAWLGSAGIGARGIFQEAIFGAYLFGDYNRTPDANIFRVLNPGAEWLTSIWDLHVNGYFPVSKQHKLMGVFSGNQIGSPTPVFFAGHTEYEGLYDFIEAVGPGVDTEVGFTLDSLKRARVFGGGYYFSPRLTQNIQGIEGGIEFPLKQGFTIEFRDTYDNLQHNTATIGIRLTFGGIDKSGPPDVKNRLLDRIPRHIGNLYNGDGIPSRTAYVNTGRTTVIQDNIWFFNPNPDGTTSTVTGFNSCTFEHPCVGLSQNSISTINSLSSNANFYLAPGTFINPAVGTGYTFANGQNIYGRTSNFLSPATGNNRALINDTLILNGNNNINSIRVNGNTIMDVNVGPTPTQFHLGTFVSSSATGSVNIIASDINSTGSSTNTIAVLNASPSAMLNINNSSISTATSNPLNTPNVISVGLGNISNATINADNTSILVQSIDPNLNGSITFGVVNNVGGVVNLNQTSILTTAENGGIISSVLNNSTEGIGNVNINSSNFITVANNNSVAAGVFNNSNNVFGISGNIQVTDTSVSVTNNNASSASTAAIFSQGTGTLILEQSIASAVSNNNVGGNTAGVFSQGGMLVIEQSSVSAVSNNNVGGNTGGVFSQGGVLVIEQSSVSALSNNDTGATITGIFNGGTTQTRVTSSVITGTGNDGNVYGIFNDLLSTLDIDNNTIAANISGAAVGGPLLNIGTLNDNGGNQCFLNGVQVPC